MPMLGAHDRKAAKPGGLLMLLDSSFGCALTVVMPMVMPPMIAVCISGVSYGIDHDDGGHDGTNHDGGDTSPFAWLGVGAAIVPPAITVAALRPRSVFLIEPSILTFFHRAALHRTALIKIKPPARLQGNRARHQRDPEGLGETADVSAPALLSELVLPIRQLANAASGGVLIPRLLS